MHAMQPLHPWQVTPAEARCLQRRLRHRVRIGRYVQDIRYVAGADVAAARTSPALYAGVVVLDYTSLAVVERRGVCCEATFPYIPGLLSFREAPALLQALAQLTCPPDILIVDGQGIAHPRGLGLASHLGVWLDAPTIGCAKSRLMGRYVEPADVAGATSPLYGPRGEVLGAVVRTKAHVKPVFVSVGHKVDLEQAVAVVLHCCRGYRLPEPTRLADHYVGALRRAHQNPEEKPTHER
ncbi:MAG: endonuclease V [Candidatus Tectimicrobiota bacterium]|nr:MAG: endonuclease V [Candidatus Tectomicrobia bacterium]